MESDESSLKQQLEELQRDLSKKNKFEDAVSSLKSLLFLRYSSSSPSIRKSFYTVICRVATVLKARYTSPGFWLAGLGLFEQAHGLVSDPSEKSHLQSCIAQAKDVLHQPENPVPSQPADSGYLFEGHLTVDPEPPQPQWLVQSNLLNAAATLLTAESSSRAPAENEDASRSAATNLIQSLIENLDDVLIPIMEDERGPPRVPPASKEVVAKLPIITITEEILGKLGKDVECAICKENLVVNDEMQELPCKHTFHPPCLKPWLDEHNSCPICRHELQTDDHEYESWKEREREAEEERKGAANAIRGGEYINGALLQVLTGSYFCERIPKANVIISYNNKPATEAVPYFEQLGPLVRQIMPVVEASPVYSMARSASGDAWKVLIDAAGAIIPNNDQETLISVTKFVDQLPSVFNEVTQGISEFKPTPSENRDRCKNSYNIKHTLLVKFSFDTIDETDLLEETLKPRVDFIGGTLEKVQLSGNHITPCIQEPKWQVGEVYTPADAIAQGLKTLSLNDSRVLVRTISNWFRRFKD